MSAVKVSVLAGQNLYLRLLILLIALLSALSASWRQVGALIALFLAYMLLDIRLFIPLLRGLRLSLPFLAAYWIFGTLFQAGFPSLALFTLKLLLLILVTVYCFGNLSLDRVLYDTRALRRHPAGRRLFSYIMATGLYLRAYARHFKSHKPHAGSSVGGALDGMIQAGAKVYGATRSVDSLLQRVLDRGREEVTCPASNLAALILMALIVLISAL